jgi:hypothetical protein
MLEDGDEMLTQAERVPKEIGAFATAFERLNSTQQCAIWAHARPTSTRRVQT